ncbi:hypothetical protein [Viridibacterium curvum]|uniref:Uncharacterized protein n=1 Tax=Viridibacterium curvum TaxID=1101404 RepID=A0ABP9QHN8_9RHOO
MIATYEICLPDYEPLLPELARIIRAHYEAGSFARAEEEFHALSAEAKEWHLSGECGQLTVSFEKHEGYYFSRFQASGSELQKGKALLWKSYLDQGGNPDAQEKP